MVRKVWSCIAVAALLSGCGTSYLFSPNPTETRPTNKWFSGEMTACYTVASQSPADSLSNRSTALKCANDARGEYLQAANDYSSVPGILQTALIPVGGAALALGIEGFSGAPVTGLGVGAASLFGLGKGYQNKSRETVYNTGASAIDCLLSNMQPYTTVSADNMSALKTALQNLRTNKADLDQKIIAYVRANLPDYCKKKLPEQKLIGQILKAANATDKATQDSLQAGWGFYSATNQAAGTIVNTVYSINEGVTKALIATEPDVQSLAATMKGVIPDSADNLAGIQKAQSSSATAKSETSSAAAMFSAGGPTILGFDASKPKPSPEDELYAAIRAVEEKIDNVNEIIGSATKLPDNKGCVALTEQAKAPTVLTLKPSGDIKLASGDKTSVTVKGVATKALVYPLFPQSSDLNSVVTASLSDSTLEIAADPATDAGSYPFIVMDGPTGAPFTVFVTKKPQDELLALFSCPEKTKKSKKHKKTSKTASN